MALIINSNIASLNSQRNLGISNSQLSKSLERLSSGLRINRAADDAAGLAIATKLGAQVRGLNQAVRNANNAISLVQTAEGGVNTLTNTLQRLRELAVQSSSDDNTATDRAQLTTEANNLITEFTRMANTTEFNTMALLDGTFTGRYFQVGANYAQQVTFSIGDARASGLGGRAEIDSDVTDGVVNAKDANFGAGEFAINGYNVAATADADDAYSVLEIASGRVGTTADTFGNISDAGGSVAVYLQINDTQIVLSIASGIAGSTVVDVIRSAVNAAAITNVSVYELDSDVWALRAKAGVNIQLAASYDTAGSIVRGEMMSGIGMGAVVSATAAASTVFGSALGSAADVTLYNGQSSALAKAVAINSIKSSSLVTATAENTAKTGDSAITAGTISSGDIYINGIDIGAVTVETQDSTGTLIAAINGKTSDTGVTASKSNDGKLILTASDGRNITVTARNSTAKNALGYSATYYDGGFTAIFRATIQLNSESNISISGTTSDLSDSGTSAANDMTKTSGTITKAADTSTYKLSAIGIDTQANAQAAILTIDAALNDLNTLRSQIGAIQNRLEFTVANLEVSSENMSASESRIKDADFAFETTRFTRSQILVQAGTAMLAQANTLPQMALQLLR